MTIKQKILIGATSILIAGGFTYGIFGADKDVSKNGLADKYNQAVGVKAKYQLDNASLVKTDIKNAELDAYGEPKDEIKVTLGDRDDTEFKPNIEFKRWNEVSFKLKPRLEGTKDVKFEGDKIKFETPKMNIEMYDITEGEGGYKYIWYLNEAPATNKIEFDIETSGLDFFYQPPLNEEQNPEADSCTETQCFKDGQVISERPENVVGSYAVYHSTKGGMNDIDGKDYKVGKAFHIYRPHIIDANGKETWGILHIENGIYSVEIPQDFLDKAAYPIKSNDTFGYTTAGSSSYSYGVNRWVGSLFTAPANVSVATKFTFSGNWSSAGTNAKATLVLHSDLTIVANGIGGEVALTQTKNWNDSSFSTSPTLTPSTDYVLSVVNQSANIVFYYDDGATNQGHYETDNNYTTPTNPSGISHTTEKYSIYATYGIPMAIHTNYGFVTSAPTISPVGTASAFDNRSRVTKDTAPEGATTITEIGWYADNATEEANYEVGLYDSDGATVPGEAGTLLQVSRTNAKGTTAGWKVVTGLSWAVTAGHAYWLGVQLDNTATTSNIDITAAGGAGSDLNTDHTTTLADPYGGGAFTANAGVAIYAVYTTGGATATPNQDIIIFE